MILLFCDVIIISERENALQFKLGVHYTIYMSNDINKIDKEELDRIEEELLEEEVRKREEEMKVEGKSVFELQKLKNKRSKKKKIDESQ